MPRGSCFTYILCNANRRVLYVGVTRDLATRLHQHQTGTGGDFTRRYRINRLVFFEEHPTAPIAIAREKQIKGWKRERKIELIESLNPEWEDLSAQILLLR
ncbi:MAG: GIY-YIG nuclease family protein [Reyranellaceae bacterium]